MKTQLRSLPYTSEAISTPARAIVFAVGGSDVPAASSSLSTAGASATASARLRPKALQSAAPTTADPLTNGPTDTNTKVPKERWVR